MANEDPARVAESSAANPREDERPLSHDDQGHASRAQQTIPKESEAAGGDRAKTRTALGIRDPYFRIRYYNLSDQFRNSSLCQIEIIDLSLLNQSHVSYLCTSI